MYEKTLDTILQIKDELLNDKQHRRISKRYRTAYHNMENMLSELSEDQQSVLFEYMFAENELHTAMMAIALQDEP